jgi:hypothetical protein
MRSELAALALVAGLLAGCATTSGPEPAERDARETARLARNLDPALRDRIADELRAAEMRFLAGFADEAWDTVVRIHDDTGDPRALEVLGKLSLYEGRFADAERHLQAARELSADDPVQRDRIDDLIRMTAGFLAYERGAIGEAERHWDAIRDPGVRAAVDRARAPLHDDEAAVAAGGVR